MYWQINQNTQKLCRRILCNVVNTFETIMQMIDNDKQLVLDFGVNLADFS